MSHYLLIYLISLLSVSVKLGTAGLTYRKFVYQKDMSEYCRRRVMPTVFLGRQVVEADAQILHFSRLEEPYSCFITVRTETGNNIIVVVQVVTGSYIQDACKKGHHQLFIHELGETFGGYWGQMPDSVMQQRKGRDDRSYTLISSTTEPPMTTTERTTTTSSTTTTPTTTVDEGDSAEEGDEGYLTLEVPILNVSARIVPGKLEIGNAFNTEDNFDVVYDVTPRAGESYETKEVPLLEIQVKKGKGDRRYGEEISENGSIAEFQMELNEIFTPDPRLLLLDIGERTNKRKSHKYRPNVSGRLDFKKNKRLFVPKGGLHKKRPLFTTRRAQWNTVKQTLSSKLYDVKQEPIEPIHISEESKMETKPNYWDAIHDILKNLSRHSDVTTEPPHKELAKILRGINNRKFNKSVYLSPDLSYMDLNTPGVLIIEHSSTTTGVQPVTYKTLPTILYPLNEKSETTSVSQDSSKSVTTSDAGMNNNSAISADDGATLALLPLALDVDSIILNVTNQIKDDVQNIQSEAVLKVNATPSVKKLDPLPLSLVDHESFENVVQSASAMATMLNLTEANTIANKTKREGYATKPKWSKKRKKRYLHAIDIEGARPHYEQEMKHVSTTSASEDFNMRQFHSLVELQDDEIQDHVAMRYLPQFMGRPLLDFCDYNETAARYVYLFNSSRLVLAVSNFTLKRMTVVVTPAQILSSSEDRCGATNIECQVSGARVCIDNLSACDGVPNCGSYEIYDEDRLTCGSAPGYRHNVFLAAITFLGVMLTLLYTIHYWLTRYIPKVSEAFFIYTDATENVLYLDSIMKSPHDIGVDKDFLRGTQDIFGYGDIIAQENAWKRFMNRCLRFLRFKKSTEELDTADLNQLYSERISLFAPLELTQMKNFGHYGVDAAVQTDLEEEMTINSTTYSQEDFSLENFLTTPIEPTASGQVNSDSTQPSDELNILQFLRKVRARSISEQHSEFKLNFKESPYQSQLSPLKSSSEEKRNGDKEMKECSTETVTIEQPQVSKPVVKRLRFEDKAIIIPNEDVDLEEDDDDAADESSRVTSRRSIVFGASKTYQQDSKPNESEEQISGTGRELKSYFNWRSGKEKKKKKSKKK